MRANRSLLSLLTIAWPASPSPRSASPTAREPASLGATTGVAWWHATLILPAAVRDRSASRETLFRATSYCSRLGQRPLPAGQPDQLYVRQVRYAAMSAGGPARPTRRAQRAHELRPRRAPAVTAGRFGDHLGLRVSPQVGSRPPTACPTRLMWMCKRCPPGRP